MSSKLVSWTRLVRYVPVEAEGTVQYGEPILSDGKDDISKLAESGQLRVRVCEGNNPFEANPTEQVQTVKTLLGPLETKDVPIIRCIGLNYKTHSTLTEEISSICYHPNNHADSSPCPSPRNWTAIANVPNSLPQTSTNSCRSWRRHPHPKDRAKPPC